MKRIEKVLRKQMNIIHSSSIHKNAYVSWGDAIKAMNAYSEVNTNELLIDFQNFLILDGQLEIDSDEVEDNARSFLKTSVKDKVIEYCSCTQQDGIWEANGVNTCIDCGLPVKD